MQLKHRALILTTAVLASLRSAMGNPNLTILSTNAGPNPNEILSVDPAGDVFSGGETYITELSGPNHQTSTETYLPYQYGQGITAITSDPAGDLFVATEQSGMYQHGSVLELSGPGFQTVTSLVNFNVSGDINPTTLIYREGNLYATTNPSGGTGFPQIFKISGPNYSSITSTYAPSLGVAVDGSGNVYGISGTTGGAYGYGYVYMLPANFQNNQVPTTLYNFEYSSQSIYPGSPLILDSADNLYGTTLGGSKGIGAVYEFPAPGYQTLNILANFNGSNGNQSYGGLVMDSAGDLFGTTAHGGAYNRGTIYELSGPNHQTLTTLASYQTTDGATPYGALSYDAAGNLYGIAYNESFGSDDIYELTNTGFFVVPEPSSVSLLAIGTLGLLRRRKRYAIGHFTGGRT